MKYEERLFTGNCCRKNRRGEGDSQKTVSVAPGETFLFDSSGAEKADLEKNPRRKRQ